jgi:DNA processing protein
MCQSLIFGLAGYPVVTVSGLAHGIDGIAHRAALEARLTTVAIPGSGLNEKVLYPAWHRDLAKKIVTEGGALLSEYEPETRAAKWTFPKRNRIMAGLSQAVLVIEAKKDSGSLITANLALDYNRDVAVVPGRIDSPMSAGPHLLLKSGATPITESADILELLGLKELPKERSLPTLTPNEKRILEVLGHEPLRRDQLCEVTGLAISLVNSLVMKLLVLGLVEEKEEIVIITFDRVL